MSHQRLTEHTPIMIIIMIIVQVHMTNNDRCVDHIKSAQENGQVQEKEACKDILITMMIKLINKQKGNQYILIFSAFPQEHLITVMSTWWRVSLRTSKGGGRT